MSRFDDYEFKDVVRKSADPVCEHGVGLDADCFDCELATLDEISRLLEDVK